VQSLVLYGMVLTVPRVFTIPAILWAEPLLEPGRQ
jgi:hypothetical protein